MVRGIVIEWGQGKWLGGPQSLLRVACVNACVSVCICVCACVHTCVYLFVCMYLCVFLSVRMGLYECLSVSLCCVSCVFEKERHGDRERGGHPCMDITHAYVPVEEKYQGSPASVWPEGNPPTTSGKCGL